MTARAALPKALFPPLAAWFRSRFPGLTEIQKKALAHTMASRHTLILAPTGSGKTLSAFLGILSELGRQAASGKLPNAVRAVYVSPLRSLDRDIHRNLEEPLAAVNAALPPDQHVRMEVRTGDTDFRERGRQKRKRPHLLLTTPESLAALLSQKGWQEGFDPFCVILDEVHSFAESKRGSFLALTLERMEAQASGPVQRVGMSATAWPVEEIANLLCGDRRCSIASVDVPKAHRLEIAVPPPDLALPPAGHNPYRVASTVAALVEKANCSLIFLTTRSAVERLALALKVLMPEWEEKIAAHHSSVDMKQRLATEQALAEGSLKAAVCSSSLELGVDFQAVDQVLLVGAPRGVSRALQRLGRSGHRVDGVAAGALVPTALPDLIQCIALRHAARAGKLDALRVPRAPLDVLAQVLLGMSIERPWNLDEAFRLVRRAGPFRELPRADFDSVIEYLSGGGKVLGAYGTFGKIVVLDGAMKVASRSVARDYYMNIGTISDDFHVKVMTRATRRLGTVEEGFLSSLRPDEAFTIGGKAVVIERMHQDIAVVRPATGERVQTPRWMGQKMPLTAGLALEERRLRAELRAAWENGGVAECRRVLAKNWDVRGLPAERAIGLVERQNQAAPVPVDIPVQVERVRSGRTLLILFHVVAGRNVNRSLVWVLSHRLGVSGSIVANHDDHSFLLSMSARDEPPLERMRVGFDPRRWREDLRVVLASTEMLGRRFRPVAETGQLLQRRTWRGNRSAKQASWSGSLLYSTLLKHEPDHPLVRETVREVLYDDMDVVSAEREAGRIFESEWEIFDLPRPSPFGLPLFAAFSRETVLQQDPERALDELVANLYTEWDPGRAETG